jgi:hypothetical protein
VSAHCTTNFDCCSGTCQEGTCQCSTASGDCQTTQDCCSGACGEQYFEFQQYGRSGQRQCCQTEADTCLANTDCCSGNCTNGSCTCSVAGNPCAETADCCGASGLVCVDGVCAGPPLTSCQCPGEYYCPNNPECLSGMCTNSQLCR